MIRITDRQFVYFNEASHTALDAFRVRQAERQKIADRERRDREHAEERAHDVAREVIERAR